MLVKLWTILLLGGVTASCNEQEPVDSSNPVEYYSSNGRTGLVYKNGNWSNSPTVDNFRMSDLAVYLPYDVQIVENGNSCLSHGTSDHSFGRFKKPIEGAKFLCGSTRFEVVRCFSSSCSNYLMSGIFGKNIAMQNGRTRQIELAFLQVMNECKGMVAVQWGVTKQKIDTQNFDFPLGTALELRTSAGILKDASACDDAGPDSVDKQTD